MVKSPRITVLMPAHNAEKTITAAMKSVLYQNYPDFELWVLENGSSDRTAEVAGRLKDPRVRVFELGPVGFQGALEYALEHARSEWLARMDADDLSFPDRFQEQMAVIGKHPELVLVGTQRAYLTPFGHMFELAGNFKSREVGRLNLRAKGADHKYFVDASVIFKRSAALEAGGYDPDFHTGDVPLWFRLLSRGKGWEISKPLYVYRMQPTGMNYSQVRSADAAFRLISRYAPEQLHLVSREPAKEDLKALSHQYKQDLWLEITKMELMTGDRQSVLSAASFLDKGGSRARQAWLIKFVASLGSRGAAIYRWRKRSSYRHRPDWERRFTDMFGPLPLAGGAYA